MSGGRGIGRSEYNFFVLEMELRVEGTPDANCDTAVSAGTGPVSSGSMAWTSAVSASGRRRRTSVSTRYD